MKRIIVSVFLMLFMLHPASHAIDLGGITKHLDALRSAVSATAKAARPISDEEEYYLGRAVAARILGTYPLSNSKDLTKYINLIGRTAALSSDKPFTYGGYHFAVLETDEINAFACPGGIIFVTKGMIDMTANEEELAAVLAHEIAHISKRDGIAAIKSSRWTEALTVIGTEAVRTYSSSDVARLVNIFEGSIDDVFKTLVVNGYGRSQEFAADEAALQCLAQSGYDPAALSVFLKHLADKGRSSGGGITKTHPETTDRIENIADKVPSGQTDPQSVQTRTGRFMEVRKPTK
jgi:predicted Zn-dependent protease